MRGRCGTPQEISIPHGTIKTDVAQMNNQFNEISIPHGTIKTYGFCFWLYTCCFISIPHGTIKTFDIKAVRNLDTKFQFHMVRLRQPWDAWQVLLWLFQFHMVRLRREIQCAGEACADQFQFHMVRLRRWCVWIVNSSTPISIPHGTIKTLSAWTLSRSVHISIPHGTIKTSRSPCTSCTRSPFQFHMVRLRRSWWTRLLRCFRYFNSTWYD